MDRGMNERIRKLRKQSVETSAFIDMERARYLTQAYKLYEGSVSIPELRALSLKYYFEHKTLYINELDLIVGEKGCSPQGAPTFPELCCHTLDDLKVMNDRELIHFKVEEEDYLLQKDNIIPYWEKRNIRHKIIERMPSEWKTAYECGIFTEFMEQ